MGKQSAPARFPPESGALIGALGFISIMQAFITGFWQYSVLCHSLIHTDQELVHYMTAGVLITSVRQHHSAERQEF